MTGGTGRGFAPLEPRFDFHFGVAAVESGQIAEGIFALERPN